MGDLNQKQWAGCEDLNSNGSVLKKVIKDAKEWTPTFPKTGRQQSSICVHIFSPDITVCRYWMKENIGHSSLAVVY